MFRQGTECCVGPQVASKIVKAGPDNGTVYMTGLSIIYKEHQVLVEVSNDGSGIVGKPYVFSRWEPCGPPASFHNLTGFVSCNAASNTRERCFPHHAWHLHSNFVPRTGVQPLGVIGVQ